MPLQGHGPARRDEAASGSRSDMGQSSGGFLLPHLRQATQTEHARVERHPMLAPLTNEQLDRQAYVRVLGAFHDFFAALEPALSSRAAPLLAEFGTHYLYLSRTERLERDLRDLDAYATLGQVRPDSVLPVPTLATPDHVLGTLYVLEGATQGGRLIAPRVERLLGFNASSGAGYFHLYADRQWQRFRALVSFREPRHDPECVVLGARDAFNVLHAHLDAWLSATTRS